MLLLSLLLLNTFQQASCLPYETYKSNSLYRRYSFNNATDGADPGWSDAPNVRGTTDLLIACAATLSLCAWTAYHPNVPPTGTKHRFSSLKRRLAWTLIAIIAPELVLFCAAEQRWQAKTLQKAINQAHRSRKDVKTELPSGEDVEPCTLSQAFFIVSGGLAVDTSTFWPSPSLTLTATGCLELLKIDPNLTRFFRADDVQDRSKSDKFGKALVCFQVMWFLAQTVARCFQKLPLTLLEIYTLTHVFCALIMYWLWFKKPYCVETPIIIQDRRILEAVAVFAHVGSKQKLEELVHRIKPDGHSPTNNDIDSIPMTIKDVAQAQREADWAKPAGKKFLQSALFELTGMNDDDALASIKEDLVQERIRLMRSGIAYIQSTTPCQELDNEVQQHRLSTPDSSLVQDDPITAAQPTSGETESAVSAPPQSSDSPSPTDAGPLNLGDQLLVPYRSALLTEGLNVFERDPSMFQMHALTFFGMIYGAAHLSAWGTHYPTRVEWLLWQISASIVAATPLFVLFFFYSSKVQRLLKNAAQRRGKEQYKKASSTQPMIGKKAKAWVLVLRALHAGLEVPTWGSGGIAVTLAMAYPFARLYLLIEAAISLRSPPQNTYQTVSWLNFIPHAG